MKAAKVAMALILIIIIITTAFVATTKHTAGIYTIGGDIDNTARLANNVAAVAQRLDTIILLMAIFIIAMSLIVTIKALTHEHKK